MVEKQKTFFTKTYGCQMNEHDSEKISWILENMNYIETQNIEEADFIIYNTCLVRENAEVKVYGNLGSLKQLKRQKPDLMIAVCGCMMQREEARNVILSKHKHVDIIFGTHNIHKLPQLINNHLQTGETIVDIFEDGREIIENINSNRKYSYKAFVNIMYGCNNFCTYCIVPYTRGRENSREPENIIKEIEELAKNGCKEVTLLGQNVNSYGKTLKTDYSFTDLLKDINKIEGIERIRFMTSHPKDLSDELINCYATLDKLCGHLHLPVQSGSNKVLKEMNRNYTREGYLKIINNLKKLVPNISITTDIIIGFPGETEEDFNDTLELVREVRFDSAFTFLYSIREGTKAAKMENQIDDKVKHSRFQRLTDTLNEIALELNQKLVGETLEVLVEEVSKNNTEVLTGRSRNNKLVHFKGNEDLIGSIVSVKIENVKTFTLEGSLV
ncbi:tRNA (N6-isopentenyl adenosine(37)-C2)-methylthiotransferase MiaB [Tissierella sp. P1]|jgi:tRNA-2-methylthio-N6-dimethylallyladenosine synthase|uniref:tRNA (N6-isopentenyl adenosine(37)-C2)-methylthiotransferase MiaB n=1 Tax=Tissierella TaxID=41273 RepID=UPI000B9FF91C|nr:tRNA (N6-isopentenyl adenosine(37)-C2)-methylthiotransferase MiaB [Tissierella sp. P1]MDU5079955.1 tRNA (N6-isopentenyl adenosine(37)-C2)-methylthiotransferase MiaB [Bacillota bacterium]OZV12974.1 tRNA (N6-isopentenyl adenosine(37)-C2)-methylthiotransferase MiaB [Tissierella sp. P1]